MIRPLGFLALACAAPVCPAAAQRHDVPFILTALDLDLRPDYASGRLRGTATLTLRNRDRNPVTEVPLLLNRLMRVGRASGSAGPLPVTQDVVVFADDSARQVNAVTVTLPAPLAGGDSVTIALDYGGHLVGYTETGSLYIRDRVDSAFTIIREDALAFPVLGRPAMDVYRRVVREPFHFEARITVPAGQVVAMGGEPLGTTAGDGHTTWRWRSVAPVPFLNIVIAPYRVLARDGIRIYHFAEDSAGARMVERAIAGAVDRLTAWYGPLGERPRLTIMEIPEGWGSQASLTAGIIQTADAFRDRAQLRQLYHELTHLWNVPDLDVPSPRWNEGLASFLQWRLAGELDGWTEWADRLERVRTALLRRCAREPRCGTVAPEAYGREGMTDLSYQSGLLLFSLLFEVMGAERFDQAYRTFLATNRQGGTTEALAAAFERIEPATRAVFEEWMRSSRWHERLSAGTSLADMVQQYRATARP